MHVPPGGGPPPHRHDFQEMFTVLDGEIEVTFRGEIREVGVPLPTRTAAPPPPDLEVRARTVARTLARAPGYRSELLLP